MIIFEFITSIVFNLLFCLTFGIFNPCSYYGICIVNAEPSIPTGIPTRKERAHIETHPVTDRT